MAKLTVARSERAPGKPHTLEYGGDVFDLPPKLPFAAWEAMEDEKVFAFFRALLGSQWGRFREVFDIDDLENLADSLGTIYGLKPGESQASSS